jgi:hypothetical protein
VIMIPNLFCILFTMKLLFNYHRDTCIKFIYRLLLESERNLSTAVVAISKFLMSLVLSSQRNWVYKGLNHIATMSVDLILGRRLFNGLKLQSNCGNTQYKGFWRLQPQFWLHRPQFHIFFGRNLKHDQSHLYYDILSSFKFKLDWKVDVFSLKFWPNTRSSWVGFARWVTS